MIRKNWKTLVITSVVVLLPMIVGLILWDQLPEQIPSHWGLDGEVDGWSSRPFAVFGFTGIMLAVQWFGILAMGADPKSKNNETKMLPLVFWIVPTLSVLLHTATYMAALGKAVKMELIVPVFMGLLFTIIGNYLPKCKQSYTIGIKLPWTLNSEENWNKTHRLAGWIWTICGVAMMLLSLTGIWWLTLALPLVMALVPCIYSYILYRKGI